MREGEAGTGRLGAAFVEARASLDAFGFEVVSELTVPGDEGHAPRVRLEVRYREGGDVEVLGLTSPKAELDSDYSSVRELHADPPYPRPTPPREVGPHLLRLLDGSRNALHTDLASNETYARLVEVVRASDPAMLVTLPGRVRATREGYANGAFFSRPSDPDRLVSSAIDLEEVESHGVDLTLAVLDEVASGTPVEWVLRHRFAEGSGS